MSELSDALDEMPSSDFWSIGRLFAEMLENAPEGSKAFLEVLGQEWGASAERRSDPPPALTLVPEEE